jgi:hypothetical protein
MMAIRWGRLSDIARADRPEQPVRPLFMPSRSGGMNEEQRIDLELAMEGRITWQQYFAKWGTPSL